MEIKWEQQDKIIWQRNKKLDSRSSHLTWCSSPTVTTESHHHWRHFSKHIFLRPLPLRYFLSFFLENQTCHLTFYAFYIPKQVHLSLPPIYDPLMAAWLVLELGTFRSTWSTSLSLHHRLREKNYLKTFYFRKKERISSIHEFSYVYTKRNFSVSFVQTIYTQLKYNMEWIQSKSTKSESRQTASSNQYSRIETGPGGNGSTQFLSHSHDPLVSILQRDIHSFPIPLSNLMKPTTSKHLALLHCLSKKLLRF